MGCSDYNPCVVCKDIIYNDDLVNCSECGDCLWCCEECEYQAESDDRYSCKTCNPITNDVEIRLLKKQIETLKEELKICQKKLKYLNK